jgi:MFS family permease
MLSEGTRRLFAERNFQLYTLGSAVSWPGFFAQTLAVSWLAWELTHSPAWLGIIAALDIVPYLVFSPWGSVLADRHDRHRLLFLTYVLALGQALLLALLAAVGGLGIAMLGALAFVHGTLHAFSVPASYGLLPRVVGRDNLGAAIAFSSSYRTLAMFIGPALAGVLLAAFPVWVCFLFNAIGYVAYLEALRRMRLPPAPPPAAQGRSVYSDYLDGLRYALTHPVIGILLVMTFFADALRGTTHRLLPAFGDRLFSSGSTGLAMLAGATGLGAAMASLWLSQRRENRSLLVIIQAGVLIGIGSTLIFVATRDASVGVGARWVFGIAAEAALTGTMILLQSQVDEQYRSRVLGLWFMVSQLANLTLLAIGPLATRFGLDAPLQAMCGLSLIAWWWFWRRSRGLQPGA